MTLSVRAKPTLYKGIRFRSRLEARWAVFFDALGIEWTYEPNVDGAPAGYLPDFDLGHFYFEVKPDNWLPAQVSGRGSTDWNPSHDRDFKRWGTFVASVAPKILAVGFGEPGTWENGRLIGYATIYAFEEARATPATWGECAACGVIRVVREGEPVCDCPQVFTHLQRAYSAVRDESYEDAS